MEENACREIVLSAREDSFPLQAGGDDDPIYIVSSSDETDEERERARGKNRNKDLFLIRNVKPWRRSSLARSIVPCGAKRKLQDPREERPLRILRTFARGTRSKRPKVAIENPAAKKVKVWRALLSMTGFMYQRTWVLELPVLGEPRSQQLLRDLGLERFVREKIPSLDKELCDEFLASFDAASSSGSVRGRVVRIDLASVAEATKLPIGESGREIRAIGNKARKKVAALSSSKKKTRGYSIFHLSFGDDEDADVMQAIAVTLSMKLECKNNSFHLVSPEILVALDDAYRQRVFMDWAGFLARLMVRAAATISRSKDKLAFQFGEWLTKIIQNELQAQDGNTKGIAEDGFQEPNPGFQGDDMEGITRESSEMMETERNINDRPRESTGEPQGEIEKATNFPEHENVGSFQASGTQEHKSEDAKQRSSTMISIRDAGVQTEQSEDAVLRKELKISRLEAQEVKAEMKLKTEEFRQKCIEAQCVIALLKDAYSKLKRENSWF